MDVQVVARVVDQVERFGGLQARIVTFDLGDAGIAAQGRLELIPDAHGLVQPFARGRSKAARHKQSGLPSDHGFLETIFLESSNGWVS